MGIGEITHESLEQDEGRDGERIRGRPETFQREGLTNQTEKDRQAGEPGEVPESKEELTFTWYLLLTFIIPCFPENKT